METNQTLNLTNFEKTVCSGLYVRPLKALTPRPVFE